MSWHFSQALVEGCLQATFLDGERFALWKSTPTVLEDSCSDKTRGTFRRSQFGMMYVPLTDELGEGLLTSFLGVFRAKRSLQQPGDETTQGIFGQKCTALSKTPVQSTCSQRTFLEKPSTTPVATLKRWVTKPEHLPLERQTWVVTTFGQGIGYLHTPTTKANYNAESMQKWPSARAFRTVFGAPHPEDHEYLMGWPIGWTDSKPLETGKFLSWLQQHS